MKLLRFMVCAAVVCGALFVTSRPASANVFCPASIAAVENLGILGRQNTYGVLLEFEPGGTHFVRLRVDSETTRYAVDFDNIELITGTPLREHRYFTMPLGEHVVAAWVESTGAGNASRLPCPIASPYNINAPAPLDPATIAKRDADRRFVRDAFSTRTVTATPVSFGPVDKQTCVQPYAPPRALLPMVPVYPPEARGANAVGTAIVRVDLDETSSVVDAIVVRSTGYAPLDAAAREAALKSSYRTETFACRSIASSYNLTVLFNTP